MQGLSAIARLQEVKSGADFRRDARPIGSRDEVRSVLATHLSGRYLEKVTENLIAYRVPPEVFLNANVDDTAGAGFLARHLAILDHVGLPPAEAWRVLCGFPDHPHMKSAYGIRQLLDRVATGASLEAAQGALSAVYHPLCPSRAAVHATAMGFTKALAEPGLALPSAPETPSEASVGIWLAECDGAIARTQARLPDTQAGNRLRDTFGNMRASIKDSRRQLESGNVSPAGIVKAAQNSWAYGQQRSG